MWHATGFSSSVASLHSRIPTAFTIAGGHCGLLLADIVASFLFLKDLGGSRAVGSGSSHCEGRVSKRPQEAVVWHASSSVASWHSRIPTAFTVAGGHRGLLLADILASFLFLKDLGGSRAVGSGSSHCEGRVSQRTQEAVV